MSFISCLGELFPALVIQWKTLIHIPPVHTIFPGDLQARVAGQPSVDDGQVALSPLITPRCEIDAECHYVGNVCTAAEIAGIQLVAAYVNERQRFVDQPARPSALATKHSMC